MGGGRDETAQNSKIKWILKMTQKCVVFTKIINEFTCSFEGGNIPTLFSIRLNSLLVKAVWWSTVIGTRGTGCHSSAKQTHWNVWNRRIEMKDTMKHWQCVLWQTQTNQM